MPNVNIADAGDSRISCSLFAASQPLSPQLARRSAAPTTEALQAIAFAPDVDTKTGPTRGAPCIGTAVGSPWFSFTKVSFEISQL